MKLLRYSSPERLPELDDTLKQAWQDGWLSRHTVNALRFNYNIRTIREAFEHEEQNGKKLMHMVRGIGAKSQREIDNLRLILRKGRHTARRRAHASGANT